jgi:protein-disulfide isomerase
LPGFDFSKLPATAQKELLQVLTDEFDYCGRALTLLDSLKKGDACKHTRRLVSWAAKECADGAPATEVIVLLSRYNQAFSQARTPFKTDDRMCKGPADAKVTVVEFADFECPGCAAARPLIEEVMKKRPEVRVCYLPYPIASHAHARSAGQAALFARDQGKFWAMHDALFDNQLVMSEAKIKELGKALGLDVAALSKVLAHDKYVAELNASKDAGKAAGVDSTPTAFINGRKFPLGWSTESLLVAIDDEVEWVNSNKNWPVN